MLTSFLPGKGGGGGGGTLKKLGRGVRPASLPYLWLAYRLIYDQSLPFSLPYLGSINDLTKNLIPYLWLGILLVTKMAAKWLKSIPYLWPKRLKNPTLWGHTTYISHIREFSHPSFPPSVRVVGFQLSRDHRAPIQAVWLTVCSKCKEMYGRYRKCLIMVKLLLLNFIFKLEINATLRRLLYFKI